MASIKFVRILTMGPTWIALAPIFIATACVSLSTIRLVGIARHHYGGADSSNMKPALILFYALVLTQGALFLLWFSVAVIRSRLTADRNFLHLGQGLIERYVNSIAGTCIEKGVATTINTNLVSFAAELLLQSQHPDDHLAAVLVLHSLVIENQDRSDGAVEQICSSEKLVYRLVRMLRSKDLDFGIMEIIAKIVAKLACKLHLADIPGAAHCISFLLDPRFSGIGQWRLHSQAFLFLHALVILGELASDPENCREIYSTMDLVPRIIAPVSNGLHMVIKDDAMVVGIVRESLRVVAKLTSGIGECSTKLCQELTTKYGRTAENLLWTLSNSDDQDMRILSVEILSRLTLDEPTMLNLTVKLRSLLVDPQESPLRIEAGKALIAREDEFPDIQRLVTNMSADEYSKEYRAVIADMLAQICARSREDQDRNRLRAVADSLPSVLKAIVTETTNITELDMSSRKFLASFLGLAVQIREKLATAEAFADAVTGLPMASNLIFAETLKRIIEMTNHSLRDDEARLAMAIIKSTIKLVTWVMEINTISPGYYIDYFRRENIDQRLDYPGWTMDRLERYVVMTSGADDNKEGYVTLHSLVQTMQTKLVTRRRRQQQQQQQ